jgi:hypothetical protein
MQPLAKPRRSEPFLVQFDPLHVLPQSERTARLEAYLEFLRARDGEPNLAAKTLTRREEFFRALDAQPVRWSGAIDRDAFARNLNCVLDDDKLDRKLVWLLAAAKSNRVEHYGVQLDLRLKGDQFGDWAHGQHMTFIDLEEFYHTRILKDCVRLFDLEFDLAPPKSFTRWFAGLVVRSPFRARLVTALCGELFGAVAFEVLWESADVFAEQPAVLERLRLLVREILIDELGHVAFGHAMLGRAGLLATRALFPTVASYFLRDLPEFAILAGGRDAFLRRVAAFDLGSNAKLWALGSVNARAATGGTSP